MSDSMKNPYREAAPWARAITLCALGAAVFYLLGRWEAAVDAELEELRSETAAVVGIIKSRLAWSDSVKILEDSLQAADSLLAIEEGETRAAIRELARAEDQVVVWADTATMDSVLSVLRMRPLTIGDTTWYAADAERTRALAAGMLRLPIAEERIVQLERLVATQRDRNTTLRAGWRSAVGRADSAEAQLGRVIPLLEAWQDYSGCKILGIVSCPSRTTAAVVGAIAGGLTIYLSRRFR